MRDPRAHIHDRMPVAALRDGRLSFLARGILARMLTEDAGTAMGIDDLVAGGREGAEDVRTALDELRKAGYLRTARRQLPTGRWISETFVFETPQPADDGGVITS